MHQSFAATTSSDAKLGELMTLASLFDGLCELFTGDSQIEKHAKSELERARKNTLPPQEVNKLSAPFLKVMAQQNAHPLCPLISSLPFQWAPPQTSSDKLYREHSHFKAHVELLGPNGLAESSKVRIGLYGMLPNCEYGLRTHPAEEIYFMLAGSAFWKLSDSPYQQLFPGERSHHHSMVPHATRTGEDAFMSVYVWGGDIATDDYKYFGLPGDEDKAG